jgi:hypothetical protein
VIAAIVIASVVAYFVGAGAAYGYFQEWHRVHGEYPEEIACGTVTLFWPVALIALAGWRVMPWALRLPVRAGRWLATPKQAALPEARVVSKEHP